MPLKAVPVVNALVTVTTLEPLGTRGDTSIAKLSKQLVE